VIKFAALIRGSLAAFACAAICSQPAGMVKLSLPQIFSDHMVLQRNQQNTVWGKATPFVPVTVSIQKDAKVVACAQTKADIRGNWRATLPPVTEGIFTVVLSASDALTLHDVAFGDVFLMVGQSNLVLPFSTTDRFLSTPTIQQITNHRFFVVQPGLASRPRASVYGQWHGVSTAGLDAMPALPYYVDRYLSEQSTIPIGLIVSGAGGTPVLPWIPPDVWFVRNKWGSWRRSSVYNAMLAPLDGLSVAGIIWYQGEGDLFSPYDRYTSELSLFIQSLQKHWHDVPVFLVQLTAFGARSTNDANAPWPKVRESQLVVAKKENAVLIVTCDTARPNEPDIHSDRKFEIGERIAKVVTTTIYGGNAPSLPEIEQKIAGDKIKLHFARQLTMRAPLLGFSIAGANKDFMPASVELNADRQELTLWNDSISKPVAIRYAWSNNPICSLFDQETALPMPPFRTDKWALKSNNKSLEEYVYSQMTWLHKSVPK
jgi:sialate O-acetylesterase